MMETDLEMFRLNSASVRRPVRRAQTTAWFLAGPIPGTWLSAVSQLPGRTLHVALAIWHDQRIRRGEAAVLTSRLLAKFGVKREAGRKALQRLEDAGLVTVERHAGRSPRVQPILVPGGAVISPPPQSASADAAAPPEQHVVTLGPPELAVQTTVTCVAPTAFAATTSPTELTLR